MTKDEYHVELWKSDGTANGTVVVKDINIFGGDSDPSYLTSVGNTLYFSADDDVSEIELWKSDGTTNGTVLAADNHDDGSGNCCHSYPRDIHWLAIQCFSKNGKMDANYGH